MLNKNLKDIVAAFFKLDTGLEFFAPGFQNANKAMEKNIPWVGLQNLNRMLYLTSTIHYYIYNKQLTDFTFAFNEEAEEIIIIEIKDNYAKLIQEAKYGKLVGDTIPSTKSLLIKDIYNFATKKYNKFNELYEKDPNKKMLLEHEGPLSEPVFLSEKDVHDYYDKMTKLIFSR